MSGFSSMVRRAGLTKRCSAVAIPWLSVIQVEFATLLCKRGAMQFAEPPAGSSEATNLRSKPPAQTVQLSKSGWCRPGGIATPDKSLFFCTTDILSVNIAGEIDGLEVRRTLNRPFVGRVGIACGLAGTGPTAPEDCVIYPGFEPRTSFHAEPIFGQLLRHFCLSAWFIGQDRHSTVDSRKQQDNSTNGEVRGGVAEVSERSFQ